MANLRAAQRAMTRQLLLDAAMDRFVASGYAATTIDEIASAAGTTRVTFYAYFGSKSEVIKALIAERLEDELAQLRSPQIADAVAAGTREQLGAWIRQAVAQWPRARPIVTIARAAQAVDPDLTHFVDAWTDETIEDVSAGLDKAGRFDADSRRLRGALAVGQLDYLFQRWADGFWGVEQDRMCELVTESWFMLLGDPA
ncbi:TetR/AcrR family transcriptional regulator [Nocardioides panzhihuensis]|uniref:AcrR family transcriptional regulator n=1 Tax=Nocardioides panzhihuensis TaxID=860243 RepID=A0A7Z0DQQ1_9ACTN|nr:TetR/AcrR family transcriptional regulator [Nocardioides panzhihuensis]NYI80050.1 AcrR family transcriptional regulator [Nocardioides panzhihuensis]